MTSTETAKEVKDLKEIKEKIDLGLLEEDDEFEEFQAEGGCFAMEEFAISNGQIPQNSRESERI